MSHKPAPVALTAAMLMARAYQSGLHLHTDPALQLVADLASRLHRLGDGCRRAALAECNGEFVTGHRRQLAALCQPAHLAKRLDELDAKVAKYCARIDKQVARISEELAPFALEARNDGDPRGIVLRLYSTDPARPIPQNGMGDESWGIE